LNLNGGVLHEIFDSLLELCRIFKIVVPFYAKQPRMFEFPLHLQIIQTDVASPTCCPSGCFPLYSSSAAFYEICDLLPQVGGRTFSRGLSLCRLRKGIPQSEPGDLVVGEKGGILLFL